MGADRPARAPKARSTAWAAAGAVLLPVRLGSAKSLPEVPWAALAVAGRGAVRITFVDLSRLEALYRVAAFFVLALIALAVAYAYHRRSGGGGTRAPATG